MTVKLAILKSVEDIVADIKEMIVGEGDAARVVGYHLNKPCGVVLKNKSLRIDNEDESYELNLSSWCPLKKQNKNPISADWMVTMVEPVTKLRERYMEDVVTPMKEELKKDGKDNKSDSTNNNTADSDKSD